MADWQVTVIGLSNCDDQWWKTNFQGIGSCLSCCNCTNQLNDNNMKKSQTPGLLSCVIPSYHLRLVYKHRQVGAGWCGGGQPNSPTVHAAEACREWERVRLHSQVTPCSPESKKRKEREKEKEAKLIASKHKKKFKRKQKLE